MGKNSPTAALIIKADRYIREDRITVLTRTPNTITTRIDGDHGRYYVIGDQYGYTCTCPAGRTHTTCSHIVGTEALAQR